MLSWYYIPLDSYDNYSTNSPLLYSTHQYWWLVPVPFLLPLSDSWLTAEVTLFFWTPYMLSFTDITHIVTPIVRFPLLNVTDPSFFSIEASTFPLTSFYCQHHCQPSDLSHNMSSLLPPTVNTSLSSFLQLPWLFVIRRESYTCLLPPNIPPRPVKPLALGTTAFNFNQLRWLLKS